MNTVLGDYAKLEAALEQLEILSPHACCREAEAMVLNPELYAMFFLCYLRLNHL